MFHLREKAVRWKVIHCLQSHLNACELKTGDSVDSAQI